MIRNTVLQIRLSMNVLICSTPDTASVNLRDKILSDDWLYYGQFHGHSVMLRGNLAVATIDDPHIFADDIDKEIVNSLGIVADNIIFLSKHKSASGRKALTVHPVGNWGRADLGGREEMLTPASPHLMSAVLRAMKPAAASLPEYEVTFEVTHHGPFLETPAFFLEIGSTEEDWSNPHAAEVLASALASAAENKQYPAAVGIAGGHYAPRFTETALSKKLDFGHMIPTYAIDFEDQNRLSSLISKAMDASNTDLIFMHAKSLKKDQAAFVMRAAADAGGTLIDSGSLELL